MPWYAYIAHFFGGAVFVNAIPHFVNGVSGRPFPSPFSKPPGRGESSSTVNVLWGTFNFVVAYLLICRVGPFRRHSLIDLGVFCVGGLVMALMFARGFGETYGGAKPRN